MTLTLITDGSADNRTGSGGWASIVHSPNSLIELSGWAEGTTSNRMEMTAVIEGLRAISVPSEITVITDSTYVLKTMKLKWYERWIESHENGSKPRPNMDLWYALIGLSKFHDIKWIKIKGHTGDYWNERADRLADQARRHREASRLEVPDFREGHRCDGLSPSGTQCKLHAGHSGNCLWRNSLSTGVEVYGATA